jgi:hypothetical protein
MVPFESFRPKLHTALRAVRLAAEKARDASVAIFADMTLSPGGVSPSTVQRIWSKNVLKP